MERSFKEEVAKLKLGEGETFHGEAILAVTKALLQSGVGYVGGYQGAPVSHVMDVLNDARDILDELGVHVETNANEAGAAAMLGASINYPVRGAVAFKSTVGTNVASDALSNLASAGVKGGALLVLGEDYGEGASIIQERTHAFAMKSQMWLLDPRPNLPKIVEMVERGFELSEASSTPVMLELRIRACHVQGTFRTKANQPPTISKKARLAEPDFDYNRICLPPATDLQEKLKVDVRWPAAVKYIRENGLNELFPGEMADLGIICQGGLYNAVIRALHTLGRSSRTSWSTLRKTNPPSSWSRKGSPPTSRKPSSRSCAAKRCTA
jgi:indolepyruvate ferredoxin oxidoreductase alpha subunit